MHCNGLAFLAVTTILVYYSLEIALIIPSASSLFFFVIFESASAIETFLMNIEVAILLSIIVELVASGIFNSRI